MNRMRQGDSPVPVPVLRVEVADRLMARLRGLIGRPQPAPGHGLLLVGERAVHGVGMRYPIDLAFLDAQGVIVSCRRLPQWRWRLCRAAVHVIELAEGECARLGLRPGVRPRLEVHGVRPSAMRRQAVQLIAASMEGR